LAELESELEIATAVTFWTAINSGTLSTIVPTSGSSSVDGPDRIRHAVNIVAPDLSTTFVQEVFLLGQLQVCQLPIVILLISEVVYRSTW
jgi:hypothetical protein